MLCNQIEVYRVMSILDYGIIVWFFRYLSFSDYEVGRSRKEDWEPANWHRLWIDRLRCENAHRRSVWMAVNWGYPFETSLNPDFLPSVAGENFWRLIVKSGSYSRSRSMPMRLSLSSKKTSSPNNPYTQSQINTSSYCILMLFHINTAGDVV